MCFKRWIRKATHAHAHAHAPGYTHAHTRPRAWIHARTHTYAGARTQIHTPTRMCDTAFPLQQWSRERASVLRCSTLHFLFFVGVGILPLSHQEFHATVVSRRTKLVA
jgi:hypothetical protein